MNITHTSRFAVPLFTLCAVCASAPALAADETSEEDFDLTTLSSGASSAAAADGTATGEASETAAQDQGPPPGVRAGPGGPPGESVFDDTWLTVGVGAGLSPSYSGSDDYSVFPLPLVVGRVGGVGISPNGPGLEFNLLSKAPTGGPGAGDAKPSISFGPSFRIRSDRTGGIKDPVVKLAGELDTAIEVGLNGGISFPGVLNQFDSFSVSTQVRWDVLGAHDGMVIEPQVTYFTPLSVGTAILLSASASFVDDDFSDYYYSVSPLQSAATGLPQYQADGGLNSVGGLAILTVDLDNNALNGGFNVYGVAGYSRLMGDGADTPYTSVRGSADQFIGGIGIGYTF